MAAGEWALCGGGQVGCSWAARASFRVSLGRGPGCEVENDELDVELNDLRTETEPRSSPDIESLGFLFILSPSVILWSEVGLVP